MTEFPHIVDIAQALTLSFGSGADGLMTWKVYNIYGTSIQLHDS